MYKHIVMLACLGVALSGCASIIKGSSEEVAVISPPATGATCQLSNSRGTWTVTTPGKAKVERSKTGLNVKCDKAGYKDANKLVSSDWEGWTFGNLILGGLPGFGVDAATGAINEYPHQIQVPMQAVPVAAKAPAPAPAKPAAAAVPADKSGSAANPSS